MTTGIRPIDVAVVSDDLLWSTDTMNLLATALRHLYIQDSATVLEALDHLEPHHPAVIITGPTAIDDLVHHVEGVRRERPEVGVIATFDTGDLDGAARLRADAGIEGMDAARRDAFAPAVQSMIADLSAPARTSGRADPDGEGAQTDAAVPWHAAAATPAGRDALRIIAVTGVKGGVGSTLLAINIARSLQQSTRHRVALVETHRGTGAISLLLRLDPPADHRLDATSIDTETVQRMLVVDEASGLTVFRPPEEGITPMDAGDLLAALRALEAHADYAVVDIPLDLLIATDLTAFGVRVVLVSTTETTSLKNAMVAFDALRGSPLVHLALTHPFDDRRRVEVDSVEKATQIDVSADLPHDEDLARDVSAHQPTGFAAAASAYSSRTRELADRLTAEFDAESHPV